MAAEFIEGDDHEYEAPDTLVECDEDLEEIQVEIDGIREQLDLYDAGDLHHLGPDWRKKAIGALIYRKVDRKKITRKLHKLNSKPDCTSQKDRAHNHEIRVLQDQLDKAKEDCARYPEAVAKQKEQLQNQKKKFAEAKTAMHIHNNLQRTRASTATKFVREFAPELIHELYDAMSDSEIEFRKRHGI